MPQCIVHGCVKTVLPHVRPLIGMTEVLCTQFYGRPFVSKRLLDIFNEDYEFGICNELFVIAMNYLVCPMNYLA